MKCGDLCHAFSGLTSFQLLKYVNTYPVYHSVFATIKVLHFNYYFFYFEKIHPFFTFT